MRWIAKVSLGTKRFEHNFSRLSRCLVTISRDCQMPQRLAIE